jgi:hypothetical protein
VAQFTGLSRDRFPWAPLWLHIRRMEALAGDNLNLAGVAQLGRATVF